MFTVPKPKLHNYPINIFITFSLCIVTSLGFPLLQFNRSFLFFNAIKPSLDAPQFNPTSVAIPDPDKFSLYYKPKIRGDQPHSIDSNQTVTDSNHRLIIKSDFSPQILQRIAVNATSSLSNGVSSSSVVDNCGNASEPWAPPPLIHFKNNKIANQTSVRLSDDDGSCVFPTPNESDPLRENIYIQGLFELAHSGRHDNGRGEYAAACLAIHHINARKIIPGYRLVMYTNNTEGKTGVAVDAFFHAIYRKPQMMMLLGSASSQVAEQLASIVSFWNIIQVSFGSTSPALSDRLTYKLFYRTVAPDSSHNSARRAFIHKFGWNTVAIFCQNKDIFTLGIADLVKDLESANISVAATIMFASQDYKERLAQLKDKDYRIIFSSFTEDLAANIFCEIYKLGMYGDDYVWIFHEDLYNLSWNLKYNNWIISCTKSHLIRAVQGAFFIRSHNEIIGNRQSVSGLTNEKFREEFRKTGQCFSKFVPQTYDAVWAIALTLGKALQHWNETGNETTLSQFNYKRHDMTEVFYEAMNKLSFSGVSGPISFQNADRVGVSAFYQNQGREQKLVALYFPESRQLDFNCSKCSSIYWQGDQIPVDRRILKIYIKTINQTAFLGVAVLAVFGIVLAIYFLIFNLHHRRLKYIKLSSPKLNNMAIIGCIMVYIAVILLGVDHKMIITEEHFPMVCMSRAFFLSTGFSLAFGAMFTKTYRVHQIFIRASSGVVKSKLLQDKRLIILVGALLLIDCFILTLWMCIDPMKRELNNLTIEMNHWERDTVYLPQVEECRSAHTEKWLGGLYVYKGLLLAVGVYMAWETRHVKIPALNDSKYIGLNVYNVVITSVIVVVMANLISERKTLSFVTVTILIFASTTTTLCLLFVPKIHAICKHADGDPVVESMGLRIECNTRRFVIDEKRELYYRAEVQNRVYKRELNELTQEITRLEKLLTEGDAIEQTARQRQSDKEMTKNPPKKERNNFVKACLSGGPGIEVLCASTLHHFFQDTIPRRRSFDISSVASKSQRSVVGAPPSACDRTKWAAQQHCQKYKKYLPEIVVSATSDDELMQLSQPLISIHQPFLLPDYAAVTHHQCRVSGDVPQSLLPWNPRKRMSLCAGLKVPSLDNRLLQNKPNKLCAKCHLGGLMTKAESEGILASSPTSIPVITSEKTKSSRQAVTTITSAPASRSLIMLDDCTAAKELSDDNIAQQRSISAGEVRTLLSEYEGDVALRGCHLKDIPDNTLFASATSLNVKDHKPAEICFEESDNHLECTNTSGNNAMCQTSSPIYSEFSDDLRSSPINNSPASPSFDLQEISSMVDHKRKEIEELRTKLCKLESELKAMEEGAKSIFV